MLFVYIYIYVYREREIERETERERERLHTCNIFNRIYKYTCLHIYIYTHISTYIPI